MGTKNLCFSAISAELIGYICVLEAAFSVSILFILFLEIYL